MDKNELIAELTGSGALREGHFRLSSGLHSDTYIQCAKLLENPLTAVKVGKSIAGIAGGNVDLVFCPALGALIVGFTTALALEVPMVFAERREGGMCLRRGFEIEKGRSVLLVEDVITTGGSIKELAGIVEGSGAVVSGIACIVNRSGYSTMEYPVHQLLSIEPEIFSPDDCPLCRDGVPLDTPGTRFAR
ncbi:MAG: orotate phosphoribosyltransferase [Actinobacteria bacterium]|nr:orotate phosphoribosyltransferase [Actinomycetota bacterium]